MDSKKILAVMIVGSIVSLSFAFIGKMAEKVVKPVAETATKTVETIAKPVTGVTKKAVTPIGKEVIETEKIVEVERTAPKSVPKTAKKPASVEKPWWKFWAWGK